MVLITPALAWAVPEDEIIEQVENANEVKTAVRSKKGTWLPVPIPIADPTIGAGLQAVLLYLHPRESEDPTIPSATSGIMGMYTNTESWLAGGFHDTNWLGDLYRFRVIAATAEFNLDYYGSSESSPFRNNSVPFNIKSDIFISQLLRQLPGTKDWYLGLRYMYTNSTVEFDLTNIIAGLPVVNADMTTSSLGMMFTYDSRDNNYYPTSGSSAELVWMRDDESWGSDFEFDKLMANYNYYFQLTNKDTLAMRVALAAADGGIPFYLLPNLKMRGFAAGRYKDNASVSGHLEWRRKFLPRWGFIVFYEAGSIADTMSELYQAEDIISYGGGLRWQVSEDKKLNLGIDLAYSGGDFAVYVQVGEKY